MGKCKGCGKNEELRMGFCFDCASSGEERAAKRKVYQHLLKAWNNAWLGHKHTWKSKIDLSWAWQRLTRTGDYAQGGTFDWEGYNWK